MNRLKFKLGNGSFEFEVEGDDDFVKEKTEWATSIVAQNQNYIATDEQHKMEIADSSELICEKKNYSSISQFLIEKKFSSELDLTLGIAYYLEVYDGKDSWNIGDLKDEYSLAKKKLPSNISRNVTRNITKSYIINPNRDDKRVYCLTDEGKSYIEMYIADNNDIPNKTKYKKTAPRQLDQEEQDKINEVKSNLSEYNETLFNMLEAAKGQKEQSVIAAYLLYLRFGEDYEFTPRILSALIKKLGIALDYIQITKMISANSKYFDSDRRGWYKFNDIGVKFIKDTILKTE